VISGRIEKSTGRGLLLAEFSIATALINVLALATPFFVIHVLNRYVAFGVDTTLATLVVGAVFAVALEFGFREARVRLATVFSEAVGDHADNRVFESFSKARLFALEAIPPAMRLELFRAPDVIRQAVTPANLGAFADMPFALLFFVVLFLISPELAFVAVGVMVIVVAMGLFVGRAIGQKQRDAMNTVTARSRMGSVLVGMMDTTRFYGAAEVLRQHWDSVSEQAGDSRDRIAVRQGMLMSMGVAAQALTSIGIITVGSIMVVQGNLNVGTMIGANILASRALGPVLKVVQMMETVSRARVAHAMLNELASLPREDTKGAKPREVIGDFAVDGLAFKWPSASKPLFNGLGFKMKAGQTLIIAGANSTGKTTLARLLAGYLEPQGGDFRIDGVDRRQLNIDWWRAQIAYLPQQPGFLPGTLRENLAIADETVDDDAINRAIDEADLRRFVDQSDGGLDMVLQPDGGDLSPGIRRRIALARALVADRPVVIVDEPSESMDHAGRKVMYELLGKLHKAGKSIIICSTDPALIKGADWIVDLNASPHQVVDLNAARKSQAKNQLSLAEPKQEAV